MEKVFFFSIIFCYLPYRNHFKPFRMEDAIEKLRSDIEEFLKELKSKRKAYQESMKRDEVLADTRKILREIKQLETAIVAVVEKHLSDGQS